MNFIDEKNRVRMVFQFVDHGLQPFFKVTAIACACQKRAHVERINGGFRQNLRRFALDNLFRQTFGNGGFANTRITDQERVVLAAAAQHLNAAFHLIMATYQRVNIAIMRLFVQINAIFGKGGLLGITTLRRVATCFNALVHRISRARNRAAFPKRRIFRHAMCDEIHRVIAGHILLLQEIGCV